MDPSTLAGMAASSSMRALISFYLNQVNRQAVVFHALDMTISSFVSNFLFYKTYNQMGEKGFWIGRVVGALAVGAITTALTGPINWKLLLTISAIAQGVGWFTFLTFKVRQLPII